MNFKKKRRQLFSWLCYVPHMQKQSTCSVSTPIFKNPNALDGLGAEMCTIEKLFAWRGEKKNQKKVKSHD